MRNLYLISQSENNGYDAYDSAVVCAENMKEARSIHPNKEYPPSLDDWNCEWVAKSKNVKVKLIGIAHKNIRKGVVCASYNAG